MSSLKDEVAAFTRQVMNDTIGLDVTSDLDPGTPIGPEGIGLESIGMLELAAHLEREYGFAFPDEAIEELLTATWDGLVDEIVRYRLDATAGSEDRKVEA